MLSNILKYIGVKYIYINLFVKIDNGFLNTKNINL